MQVFNLVWFPILKIKLSNVPRFTSGLHVCTPRKGTNLPFILSLLISVTHISN